MSYSYRSEIGGHNEDDYDFDSYSKTSLWPLFMSIDLQSLKLTNDRQKLHQLPSWRLQQRGKR